MWCSKDTQPTLQPSNTTIVVMDIEVATNATPEQITEIKTELSKFCPIAKVIRAAGTPITENWTTTPL